MAQGGARRALIVGGGIGGTTAACALQQVGWDVAVFERAPAFAEVGSGLTLWTNAIDALGRLGLAEQVVATGGRMRVAEIRSWRGSVLSHSTLDDLEQRLGAPTICIHRAELLSILVSHLRPGVLNLGATCVDFTQDEQGVTVALEDGREERGDVLIGADGLRSTVRRSLLGTTPPRFAGYSAWRGIAPFHDDSLPVGYTSETWGPGRRFGIVPLGKGRIYWFATENTPEDTGPAPGIKTKLLGLFGGWHSPIRAILEATPETAILYNGLYDRDPSPIWGWGPFTLLGDAIHPTTPNLGQGACQAIEDAVVLSRCLEGQKDAAAALRTYETLRQKRTAMITLLSRRIGKFAQASHPAACFLRDTLARILPDRQTQKQMDAIIRYKV